MKSRNVILMVCLAMWLSLLDGSSARAQTDDDWVLTSQIMTGVSRTDYLVSRRALAASPKWSPAANGMPENLPVLVGRAIGAARAKLPERSQAAFSVTYITLSQVSWWPGPRTLPPPAEGVEQRWFLQFSVMCSEGVFLTEVQVCMLSDGTIARERVVKDASAGF